MKDLISKEYKSLLWKDEINEQFLLFDWGEIFEYSDNLLGVHCFSIKALARIAKMTTILNLRKTDDPMFIFQINVENLPKILASYRRFKRISVGSKKHKMLEKKLVHKIIAYKPTILGG